MHQRTIMCSCIPDGYPLSQDSASAEEDARAFLAQHAHPARPRPPLPQSDSPAPAGYLAVFIDGPRDGEVRPLPEYVDVIPDATPTIPGVYKPEEALVDVTRVLHYQWYAPTPSVLQIIS